MDILPKQLKKLNNLLNEDVFIDNKLHYDLRNVARRIKVYYGKEYGLEINSEVGEYTDVVIRIPYAKEMGEDIVQVDDCGR